MNARVILPVVQIFRIHRVATEFQGSCNDRGIPIGELVSILNLKRGPEDRLGDSYDRIGFEANGKYSLSCFQSPVYNVVVLAKKIGRLDDPKVVALLVELGRANNFGLAFLLGSKSARDQPSVGRLLPSPRLASVLPKSSSTIEASSTATGWKSGDWR